jgi:hypothetical protein
MNPPTWLPGHRMLKFRDDSSRWERRELSIWGKPTLIDAKLA